MVKQTVSLGMTQSWDIMVVTACALLPDEVDKLKTSTTIAPYIYPNPNDPFPVYQLKLLL